MTLEILELNHVALHVRSTEASERFYGGTLGLPTLPRPAFPFPGAWFRIGTTQELHLIEGRLAELVHDGNRGGHFAIRVADLAAAAALLKQKQAPFNGPFRRPDGALQIFLADPDGHTVELCQLSAS